MAASGDFLTATDSVPTQTAARISVGWLSRAENGGNEERQRGRSRRAPTHDPHASCRSCCAVRCRIYPLVFASVRGLLSRHARVGQRARTMRTKGLPAWTKPLHRRQTSIRRTSLSQAFPSIRGPGPRRKRQRTRRAQTLLIRANPTARSAALLEMTSFTSKARPRPTTRRPGGACRPRRSSVRKPIAIAHTTWSSCGPARA
jgi:hypothetical protein